VENPVMLPLEKNPSDAHALKQGKSFAASRTVSKISGTKDDDMFFNGFSSVTRASTSPSSYTFF